MSDFVNKVVHYYYERSIYGYKIELVTRCRMPHQYDIEEVRSGPTCFECIHLVRNFSHLEVLGFGWNTGVIK